MNVDGAPILDARVLADLRAATGDDEAFMQELLDTYVTEGAANIADVLAAASSRDAAAIVRPAHSLKSTSASVGAMRLSAICRSIEEAGRAAQTTSLHDDAQLARATWDETLAALAEAGLR